MSDEGREPHLDAFRTHFGEAPAAPPMEPAGSSAQRPSPPAPRPGAPPPVLPRPSFQEGWRDTASLWLGAVRDDPRARAVALAVLVLLAGLVWYRAGLAGAGAPPAAAGTAAASSTTPTTGSRAADAGAAGADGPVYVHVAGAVRAPGLYRLRGGARVADAVKAAGGATAEADTDRLNLAAPVADGQQVYVPALGQPAPPSAAGAAPAPGTGPGGAPGAVAGDVVNVNTATAADLEALPGIGPVIAEAIVDERERGGPFASVDDLLRVSGIGEARLEELRPHVAV